MKNKFAPISQILICLLFSFLFYSAYFISYGYGKDIEQEITFELEKGKVTIRPCGLEIAFQKNNSATVLPIITSASNTFSLPVNITHTNNIHEIEYKNGYKAQIFIINDRLHVKIYPTEDNMIKWPVLVENEYLDAYLIPEGEGLYIPRSDKKIRSLLHNYSVTHMQSMPFLGYMYNDLSITLILHNPYRTTTILNDYGKGQSIEYDFRQRDGQSSYEVSLAFSKEDNLEPSRIFKDFLKKSDKYVEMKQKIKQNPEISKLAGAMHIYVWGDGRTIKALQALHNLGITKAWIGYEPKPNKIETEKWNKTDYVNEEFIKEGKKLGYLIGVYDSYHTMQSPENSDSFDTDFGKQFYPTGCVCGKEGKITKGFGGRGCAVSMTALDQINSKIVYDRVKNFIHQGVNSYPAPNPVAFNRATQCNWS